MISEHDKQPTTPGTGPGGGSPTGQAIAVGHIGITVSDLDRSIEFYTALGLECRSRFARDEEYLGVLVGHPGVELHGAILQAPGDGFIVEVLEYVGARRRRIDPDSANPATAHLSLLVADVDALVERVRLVGGRTVSAPVMPTAGVNVGGRAIYLLDPDGFRVELIQTSRRLDGSPIAGGTP